METYSFSRLVKLRSHYANFAHDMVQEAFGTLNPEEAQHSLPVEEYAATLAKLKLAFINHSRDRNSTFRSS